MFATIKSLIPEPRQAIQPRGYIGRHRRPEAVDTAPRPSAQPVEITAAPLDPGPQEAPRPVPAGVAAAGAP